MAVHNESLLSPTESFSSFDMLSGRSRSSTLSSRSDVSDSDDEVVLSVTSSVILTEDISDEDDFVLLGHSQPRTAAETPVRLPPTTQTRQVAVPPAAEAMKALTRAVDGLSLGQTPSASQAHLGGISPPTTPKPTKLTKNQRRKLNKRASKQASPSESQRSDLSATSSSNTSGRTTPASPFGLGARSVVDDASVKGDDLYEEAVAYINSVLSNPKERDGLAFLQALIVELGITFTSLPESLNQARAVLKAKAFINVRDYLTLRSQGLEALRSCMFPSKSALVRDVRRRRVKKTAIKNHGLQVLLVSCY